MKRICFDSFGDPAQVLYITEADEPTPGPGEVVVRMRMRGVNIADLYTIRGRYGVLPELPATPGIDGVGRVAAVGPGVSGFEEGERVIPTGAIHGGPGTWQEMLVAPVSSLVKVPDAVSDMAAAQFSMNPISSWVVLNEILRLQAGQWLLLTAGASVFARISLQLAHRAKAKVICAVRSRARASEMLEAGADAVVCTDEEDLATRVRDITKGAGVDCAVDAVAGKTTAEIVRALKPGGSVVVFGLLSTPQSTLDLSVLLYQSLTVRGFWLTHWARSTPVDERQRVFAALLKVMGEEALHVPTEAEYELNDFQAAISHADRFGRQGKVLLFSE